MQSAGSVELSGTAGRVDAWAMAEAPSGSTSKKEAAAQAAMTRSGDFISNLITLPNSRAYRVTCRRPTME